MMASQGCEMWPKRQTPLAGCRPGSFTDEPEATRCEGYNVGAMALVSRTVARAARASPLISRAARTCGLPFLLCCRRAARLRQQPERTPLTTRQRCP